MSRLVLYGGTVFDGERVLTPGTSVAVVDGRVAAVGSAAEVRAVVGSSSDVLDLAGRMLLPGFTDAHVHPVMAGVERLGCDLSAAGSAAETLAAVRAYADQHPGPGWIQGGGWAKQHFAAGLPTAAELDAAVPDRPVVLRDNSHHALWVNTVALQRAGLAADHPATLHEAEMDLVIRHLPPTTLADQVAGLRTAQAHLHSVGVTGWQDAIIGSYAGHPDPTSAYLSLVDAGLLTARVVGALWWPRGADDVAATVADLSSRRAAVATAAPGGRFRATSVKVMQDGVVESRTAGLSAPYVGGCACATGLSYVDPAMFVEAAKALARNGFQLHVHAIGDRAVTEALDAIEAALADPGAQPDLRHHIAHLQVVRPADVPRFGAAGVTANLQALWACHEPAMDDLNIPLLGEERAGWQYPFGALARTGAPLAMGSDWPVSTPDPFAAIQVAVTRRARGGDRPPLLPEQAIDVRTALSAYTLGSARLNRLDDGGRVAAGALADLVVLDRDVTAVPSSEIADTRVDLTMVDGVVVHERAA